MRLIGFSGFSGVYPPQVKPSEQVLGRALNDVQGGFPDPRGQRPALRLGGGGDLRQLGVGQSDAHPVASGVVLSGAGHTARLPDDANPAFVAYTYSMADTRDGYCRCWITEPPVPHDGHCCMDGTCHAFEGMAAFESVQR